MGTASRHFRGDTLRAARKNAFKTQEELAKEMGVTLRGYQRWERGEGGEPHPHNILKLAEFFEMDPLDFFSFEDAA